MTKNKYHDKFCAVPWQNQANILPKNIFQTFESCDVSPEIKGAMQTWQHLNPTWTYHFYTADQRRSFIQKYFQPVVLNAYDALIPGSYQADMWRFCVLYIHGGIYADHKVILNKPLEDFVPNNVVFAAYKDSAQWQHAHYVLTGLLIAQPQHPIFLKAIACIVDNVAANAFGLDPLCPTGPGLLGKAFNLVLHHEAGAEILAGVGAIEERSYQLFPCPYDTSPPTFTMFGVDNCFALYPSHRDASINITASLSSLLKSDYAAAWFLGKIYKNKEQKPPHNRYAKKRRANYLRRKIRALLKQGYYELAQTLIKATLGENKWQPKIWWYCLKSLHK